jgi:membrane-associated phospholipid phosphatase
MAASRHFLLFMPAMTIKTNSEKLALLPDTTVAFNSPWRWGVPLFALTALSIVFALNGNVPIFYFMNRIMSYAGDGFWIHLSLLGDGQLVILFVLPFIGRRPDVVWQFLLAFLIAGLFVHGMKELFSALRPPASLLAESFHLIGPALRNNAFPSGHTTAAFALAGLVCVQKTDIRLKMLALLLAMFVGFSRIASGVHWPLDVLGAVFGGWMVAIAAVWVAQHWRAGLSVWVQRIFALIVTPLSVWAVWSLWQHLDDVYPGTGLMKVLLLAACLMLSIPGQLRLFNLKR